MGTDQITVKHLIDQWHENNHDMRSREQCMRSLRCHCRLEVARAGICDGRVDCNGRVQAVSLESAKIPV